MNLTLLDVFLKGHPSFLQLGSCEEQLLGRELRKLDILVLSLQLVVETQQLLIASGAVEKPIYVDVVALQVPHEYQTMFLSMLLLAAKFYIH